MAIAYLGSSTNSGPAGTSYSSADPGFAGATLLAIISIDDGATALTPPDGTWAQVYSDQLTLNDTQSVDIWVKASATGSGSYSFTGPNSGGDWQAIIRAYSGVDTTTPVNAKSHNVQDSNHGSPYAIAANTITTTVNGCQLVYVGAPDDGTATASYTAPSGYGNAVNAQSSLGGAYGGSILLTADQSQTTAGATGTVTGTITQAGGNAAWIGYLIALAPSGGGGGGSVSDPPTGGNRRMVARNTLLRMKPQRERVSYAGKLFDRAPEHRLFHAA